MMKVFMCGFALAAVGVFTCAHAAPERAATAHLEAALGVQQSLMGVLRGLTEVLQDVHDRESADAAAPRVHALARELNLLQRDASGFAAPSPQEDAAYKAAMNGAAVRQTVDAFMQSIITLSENKAFGSSALVDELATLFSGK